MLQQTAQRPTLSQKQVNRLAISPDKRILAAAGYNAVRLYDINDRASNNPVSWFPFVLDVAPCSHDSKPR